jgi:hypothetical protein
VTHPADFHLEWKRATPSTLPTAIVHAADGRAWWLHSRVDPREEAQFLIEDVPAQERTLYVVLGFGLGYHVKAVLDRVAASSHVMVIEPDTAALSDCARAHEALGVGSWIDSPRLHLLVCRDPAVLPLRLAASFSAYDALTLQMIPHMPSMQLGAAFFQAAIALVQEHLPAAATAHLAGLESTLENDLRNFWANLAPTWRGGDIDSLRNVVSAKPVVIVSAGPSLTDALPFLLAMQDRALLVATAPTVPVLLSHGIRPDLVVAVDPFPENLAHFVTWDGTDIPLVYYQKVFRGILERYQGPVCAFSMRDEQPLPLKADSRPSPFFPGGSVAFSALQLAHHMGGSPIVFVGQDFAFADGRTHAVGVDYGRDVGASEPRGAEQLFDVPGVAGRPVKTNGLYYSYLLHMQEYLLAYRRVRPDVRHINASSGAVILGTERRTLERVVADLLPAATEPPGDVVRRVIVHARRPVNRAEASAFVTGWRADVDRLLRDHAVGSTFEPLFAAFADTTLYAQAPVSYTKLRYVFDSRYASRGDDARVQFKERFVDHLRHIGDALAHIGSEYQT